jgi:DNA-binding LacI/PurR family transcriptional regulator
MGTVSAVINGKNTVKTETREAVLGVMKDLHYRPRGSARAMKNSTPEYNSIGLLIRELDNPFYMAIASGAREYASSKGYWVNMASSEGDHTSEERITQSFSRTDRKGAIIAPVLEGTSEIEHLFRLKLVNFPFVLLENVKGIQANVVSIDNMKAMKEAIKYLMDNGHSRIVHFSGPKHASHTYERIEGFCKAYSESHHVFDDSMIVPAGAHLEDGYRTCLQYFRNRSRASFPTAIVCYNDLVAIGVLTALSELHIAVPDEISVVGNDDIPFSRHHPVQLTTIHAPMFELGQKAAELLINNIESPKTLPIEHVVLDAEFVIRKSTMALQPAAQGPSGQDSQVVSEPRLTENVV